MKTKGHLVVVEEPHKKSLAAMVLLTRRLSRAEREHWFTFRDELLDEAEARDGKLVCHYCERDDLVREVQEFMKKPSNLATIDHVVPVSKGGPQFEKKNCVIACYPCNQRKADNMPR